MKGYLKMMQEEQPLITNRFPMRLMAKPSYFGDFNTGIRYIRFMMHFSRILLLLLLAGRGWSQDISGLWTGYLYGADSLLAYELVVSEKPQAIDGFGQLVFWVNGVENTGVKRVELKKKNRRITLEDFELVYNNYTTPPRKVKLYATLELSEDSAGRRLHGTYNTRSVDYRNQDYGFLKGSMELVQRESHHQSALYKMLETGQIDHSLDLAGVDTKKAAEDTPPRPPSQPVAKAKADPRKATGETAAAKPVTKPEAVAGAKAASTPAEGIAKAKRNSKATSTAAIKQPAALKADRGSEEEKAKMEPKGTEPALINDHASRTTEVIYEVYLESDSIMISLFDNGEVDGDTVSVFLGNRIWLSKVGLSARAFTETLYLDSLFADGTLLILFADNLGSIPPNTGLLILQDGDKRYDINFSGDLTRNPAIELRRRPKLSE